MEKQKEMSALDSLDSRGMASSGGADDKGGAKNEEKLKNALAGLDSKTQMEAKKVPKISEKDVDLLVNEFQISANRARKLIQENEGDLTRAVEEELFAWN